jgi:hypothetical protein
MSRTPTARAALPLRLGGSLIAFVAWLDRHGETSLDHQSYFAGRWGGAAKALYYRRRWLGTLAVAPMILSEALLPAGRRLFGPRLRFPIADAHYAMGFAALYRLLGDQRHLQRARHFLDMLEATRCPGSRRPAWGYPFDWVTRTGVMAASTPFITSTPYVYEAFAALHAIDAQSRWMQTMRAIAAHALHDIPERRIDEDCAAAGYHPQDHEGCVVNASAYRAFLLLEAAGRFGDEACREAGLRNLRFVLRSQRSDGGWPYATDGVRDFIDHFHTCFVLKALAKVEGLVAGEAVGEALQAGVRFYAERLFDARGLPRPFAKPPRLTVYRQELYDYAECLNLGVLLGGRFAALDERVAATLEDLLARWQLPDGSFRSRRLMFGWDTVPMHRWAQSQAFRSLSLLGLRAVAPDAFAVPAAMPRAVPIDAAAQAVH